jgi:hypothetical protein
VPTRPGARKRIIKSVMDITKDEEKNADKRR